MDAKPMTRRLAGRGESLPPGTRDTPLTTLSTALTPAGEAALAAPSLACSVAQALAKKATAAPALCQ
jgi:hypothetical protein